jgi:hypothetical protein
MYDQRLSNRENHRQFEGVSAPPAINIRVHRNEGNMPFSCCALVTIKVTIAQNTKIPKPQPAELSGLA